MSASVGLRPLGAYGSECSTSIVHGAASGIFHALSRQTVVHTNDTLTNGFARSQLMNGKGKQLRERQSQRSNRRATTDARVWPSTKRRHLLYTTIPIHSPGSCTSSPPLPPPGSDREGPASLGECVCGGGERSAPLFYIKPSAGAYCYALASPLLLLPLYYTYNFSFIIIIPLHHLSPYSFFLIFLFFFNSLYIFSWK